VPAKVNVQIWHDVFVNRSTRWYPKIEDLFGERDHNDYIFHSINNNDLLLQCSAPKSLWGNTAGTWHPVSHTWNPIPINIDNAKVFYWELIVQDEEKGQGNAMGLMIKSADLSKHMPGWEPGTYAMHSDDGHAYYNNKSSIYECKSFAFGPAYQTNGVIIGCGYNFLTREVFFTHNGLLIGVPFLIPNQLEVSDISPCIGMMTQRSIYRINVGQKPFAFNIDAYICGENIEKMTDLTFDESDTDLSDHYRISRKETIEKIGQGQNFLQEFVPKVRQVIPAESKENVSSDESDESSET